MNIFTETADCWGGGGKCINALQELSVVLLSALSPSSAGLSSTCPLSTPSVRWRWRLAPSMTSPTPTMMANRTTWPFTCRFLTCYINWKVNPSMVNPCSSSHTAWWPWWGSSSSPWALVASNRASLPLVETSSLISRLGFDLPSVLDAAWLQVYSFWWCRKNKEVPFSLCSTCASMGGVSCQPLLPQSSEVPMSRTEPYSQLCPDQ